MLQYSLNMGIKLHVAWRDKPTRRGFSLIDSDGERSITVIGERLAPLSSDDFDWNIFKKWTGFSLPHLIQRYLERLEL